MSMLPPPTPHSDPELLLERIKPIGSDLAHAFHGVLASLPGSDRTPTSLSRQLGLSRVIIGKLLNGIDRSNEFEVLERVPGPESLRSLVHAASELGSPAHVIEEAHQVIDRFARLIREDFGTRGALNAAISPHLPELHVRFEHTSRYQVYKGMRQILGVEADTWLTAMFFVPSKIDDQALSVTTIHGPLGMRRLRQDVNVYFTFGQPQKPAPHAPGVSAPPIDLSEYYTREPAQLESDVAGGQLVHRLSHDNLGRHSAVDMVAVSHDPKGSRRYASSERPRGGIVVFPDVPVKTLVCDAIVHHEVFPHAIPELILYNPGSRGPANPADRKRDIDRVEVPDQIQALGSGLEVFTLPEIPNYAKMVDRVCAHIGHEPSEFRVFRLHMAYPVHGFQIVMAFDAPQPQAR